MSEEKRSGKKVTIEEAFRRVRPLFIMLMMFPLFGLIAVMILLYILQVKNLLLMEGLVVFAMIIYIVTTYLVGRKMGQMGEKANSIEFDKKE